jgi:hypothetical protein
MAKGCKTCKKKPELTELPEVIELDEPLLIFDSEDIVKAYYAITEKDGIRDEIKPLITGVYRQVFNEEFVYERCISCNNNQLNKFRNYIRFYLKINI